MYTEYIKYFLFAFLFSAAAIPGIIVISKRLNLYDNMGIRKIHNGNISNIGGAAIFFSFIISTLTILPHYNFKIDIYLYLPAAIFAFFIGFIDDIRPYSGKFRLVLQFICAGVTVSSGIMFEKINLFGIAGIESGFLTAGISILMIVLFMNAVNLIDGMDGIAAGILLTANIFLCVLGFLSGNPAMILLSLVISGAISGFFIFNYPPAKIFLGDGGAYFLGFIFATLPMYAANSSDSSAILYILPLVLMVLPVADLIYVALMRIKTGRSIFQADKKHLHHRLMKLGMSNRNILFLVTGYTAVCGFASLLMYRAEAIYSLILLFSILFITVSLYLLLKNAEKKSEIFNHLNKKSNIVLTEACTSDR